MKKAMVATTAALTMLAGCGPDVLDAEKFEKSQKPTGVMEVVANQHAEVNSLALRYLAPELMLTKWDNPERLNLYGASASVYREHGANTEPGMAMLSTAVNNVGILLESVRNGKILTDSRDYRIELNETSHQVYMIFGEPKSLARIVPQHRGGPQVAVGMTEDERTEEIVTLMASFPRGHFMLHTELDNTRWLLQSAVCGNFINVIPGQTVMDGVRKDLVDGESFDEKLAIRVESIRTGICQSLALAQVAKDGEARGIVSGYDYYKWLLGVLHEGGEVGDNFLLPRFFYDQIAA